MGAGQREREKIMHFDQLLLPPADKIFTEYFPIIFLPGAGWQILCPWVRKVCFFPFPKALSPTPSTHLPPPPPSCPSPLVPTNNFSGFITHPALHPPEAGQVSQVLPSCLAAFPPPDTSSSSELRSTGLVSSAGVGGKQVVLPHWLSEKLGWFHTR